MWPPNATSFRHKLHATRLPHRVKDPLRCSLKKTNPAGSFGSVLLLGMGKWAQISLETFGEATEFRGVDVLLGISCSRPFGGKNHGANCFKGHAMVELLEMKLKNYRLTMANYRELGFMADISIFNDHLQDLELYKQKQMWCLFLPLSPPLSPDLYFSAERPAYKPTKNVVPQELEVGLLPRDNPSNSPASWPDSKNLFITT